MGAAVAMTLTLMNVSSCRPAAYEVIRGANGKPNNSGNPNTISPDTGRPTPPLPVGANVLPTARVETIWNGVSVVKVRVNQPVSIRPTWDTLDPDDIGRSACTNPGIVKASYDIGLNVKKAAVRTVGCETLAVPYIFTQTGEYEIKLLVTSNEDEQAWASMILTVVDATAPLTSAPGGFTISANPMVAGIGQTVTFVGICQTPKASTIKWDFADGGSATGATVGHPYKNKGQYLVAATCTDIDGDEMRATVTIVIIDRPIIIPGNPGIPGNPTGPNDPGTPGQNPGQGPTQGPGQGPKQN